MKKLFLSTLLLALPLLASAYDCQVDGIYYNLNSEEKTAEVTYQKFENDIYYSDYSGSVVIPEKFTYEGVEYSVTSIGFRAFDSCTGLTSVNIPSSVTSIGTTAFQKCSRLTSVHITDLAAWCKIAFNSSTSNPLSYAHHLFLNGEEIKDLVIPSSVTIIKGYAFEGCSGLTSLTIPNSVDTILEGAFSGCTGLTSLTIPNSVIFIEMFAFQGCSGLTSVTIGSSVRKIGNYAFAECYNLDEVYCLAENVPGTSTDAFEKSYPEYRTLYVPTSSLNAYKTTEPWSLFGTIKAISGSLENQDEGITIDETNFPDEEFCYWVWCNLDNDHDGILTDSEIKAITNIDCSAKTDYQGSIKSLKGIEFFTSLKELNCSRNQITSLDVSIYPGLTKLDCSSNQLSELDVSMNTYLDSLDCSGNHLQKLDVTKNLMLSFLDCSVNQLNDINVSKNTVLASLTCGSNKFSVLDISNNKALTWLSCANSQLSVLDVSNNLLLKYLQCQGSKLSSLDLSKNTALTYLDCNYNQLNVLEVSKNTALVYFHCAKNQLKEIDVSNNTALTWLECSSNQLSKIDVSKNISLNSFDCSNNQLGTIDVSSNTALTRLVCSATQLGNIDLSHNSALTTLNCSSNQLSNIDVSHNTALTSLNCSSNHLQKLDVSNNKELTSLNCTNNQLMILNLAANSKITDYKLYSQKISLKAENLTEGIAIPVPDGFDISNLFSLKLNDTTISGSLTEYNNRKYLVIAEPGTEESFINGKNLKYYYDTKCHVTVRMEVTVLLSYTSHTDTKKCATPIISYTDKKLTYTCETEDVVYHSAITDTDIANYESNEVSLSATYEISVYATKDGYENSDVATATLVWTDAVFTETTPETPTSAKAIAESIPMLISAQNGTITVRGEQNGLPLTVFTADGKMLGSATIKDGQASIATNLQRGEIAIVKVGSKSVKIKM